MTPAQLNNGRTGTINLILGTLNHPKNGLKASRTKKDLNFLTSIFHCTEDTRNQGFGHNGYYPFPNTTNPAKSGSFVKMHGMPNYGGNSLLMQGVFTDNDRWVST